MSVRSGCGLVPVLELPCVLHDQVPQRPGFGHVQIFGLACAPDPGIADAPDVPGILFSVDVLALVAGAHDGLGGHAAQQLFAVAPDRLALPGRAAVLARALGLLDFLLPETEFPVFSFEHALGVLDQQVRELEEWFIRRVVVRPWFAGHRASPVVAICAFACACVGRG